MTTFILAFVLLGLVIIAMSVGVLCGRSPIKGSCGGMSALGFKEDCEICGGDQSRCDEEQKKNGRLKNNTDLAYDASAQKK